MKLLSIESSCDDTCISIYEATGGAESASFKILANNTNSQIKVHIPYGGVYPVLAKCEHAKNLPILLEASLKQANLTPSPSPWQGEGLGRGENPGIDAIAVTYGPGLEMCLWEGITFAKDLAKRWQVPIIPVNHMEGHVLSVFGKDKGKFKIPKVKTPMLSLLVSGGHTQLVLVKKPARMNDTNRSDGWMNYEIIGESLDDAVGEAFDKVARTLGLPYPGGPEISRLAEKLRATRVQKNSAALPSLRGLRHGRNFLAPVSLTRPAQKPSLTLPRPMLHTKDFNFSFSGLKTAVLYLVRNLGGLEKISDKIKAEIALEFENAAIECLTYKTAKAIEQYKIKTLTLGGGVAANKYLRGELSALCKKSKIKLFIPTPHLSTDNSLMIGIAGYLNYVKNKKKVPKPESIKATGNLRL